MPLMPVLEWATDLAASSARFNASGEPMSGRFAPLRTATPLPERARSTRLTAPPLAVPGEVGDRLGGQDGEVAAGAAFEILQQTVRGAPGDHDFRPAGALECGYEIEHQRLHPVGAENFHCGDPFTFPNHSALTPGGRRCHF